MRVKVYKARSQKFSSGVSRRKSPVPGAGNPRRNPKKDDFGNRDRGLRRFSLQVIEGRAVRKSEIEVVDSGCPRSSYSKQILAVPFAPSSSSVGG